MNWLFSLFSGESAAVAWAMVGGMVVAAGLVIERISDYLDERFFGGYKAHKKMERFGWRVLMAGILIEVADAGWTAHEIKQAQVIAEKNDPLNQTISALEATVSIRVKNVKKEPRTDLRTTAWIECLDSNSTGIVMLNFPLQANDFVPEISVDEKTKEISRRYVVHFHGDERIASDFADAFVTMSPVIGIGKAAAKDANRVATIEIATFFLPSDTEVEGGSVTLVINGSISRYFAIFPQKALPPPRGVRPDAEGFGLTIVATNFPVRIVTP